MLLPVHKWDPECHCPAGRKNNIPSAPQTSPSCSSPLWWLVTWMLYQYNRNATCFITKLQSTTWWRKCTRSIIFVILMFCYDRREFLGTSFLIHYDAQLKFYCWELKQGSLYMTFDFRKQLLPCVDTIHVAYSLPGTKRFDLSLFICCSDILVSMTSRRISSSHNGE